jgi:di/tripeptidase
MVSTQIDRNELAQLGADLTSIPSPTGQEKAIAEFILSWFEANGIKPCARMSKSTAPTPSVS